MVEVYMKKKPIAVDMEIIIDPYKLLSIINCVDKIYSEIVIPLPLSYIEIWHPKWRTFTFRPFEDSSIMDKGLETFFGYTNGITTNNFVSGIQLFRMAYEKGMVRVIDMERSAKYESDGREILKVTGNFNNIKRIKTGHGTDLYINPDYPISEMLIGMKADGYNVIYGNVEFLNFWNNRNQTYSSDLNLNQTPFYSNVDGTLQTLLYTDRINSLSEAFNYVNAKNSFEKLDIELRNTVEDYEKKKELCLITLEYSTTTAVDSLLEFPLLTTSLFAYRFVKRSLHKKQ